MYKPTGTTDGSLAPGTKLPSETELIAEYAVSRTVIREAVADRIQGSGSSIWLSGGVDSAAIAVAASQVAGSRGVP
mgnify:CR=1 FL=1